MKTSLLASLLVGSLLACQATSDPVVESAAASSAEPVAVTLAAGGVT